MSSGVDPTASGRPEGRMFLVKWYKGLGFGVKSFRALGMQALEFRV